MTTKKDTRARNWAFIQYDDSSPENWRELLNETKIPWIESPLHDKDVNATGEIKKPHRHIILANDNKKSFEQMQIISNLVSGCKVESVQNMKGYIRYLVHLDNPEKFQYKLEDVICHNGFDIDIYLKKSSSDIREVLKDIFSFIRKNDVLSYSDFIDYCIENDLNDWFEVSTMKHTLPVKEYIKSYSYKHVLRDPDGNIVTDQDGQVIYVGDFIKKK